MCKCGNPAVKLYKNLNHYIMNTYGLQVVKFFYEKYILELIYMAYLSFYSCITVRYLQSSNLLVLLRLGA